MIAIGVLFLRMLCDCFKSRQRLQVEIVVLRHQLNVVQQRTPRRRLQLRWVDRALFIWLYRRWPRILDAVTIVRPETVVGIERVCRLLAMAVAFAWGATAHRQKSAGANPKNEF